MTIRRTTVSKNKQTRPIRTSRQSPQQYLTNWMKTFVEKPHPYLGDMPPCPYARKARLDNKVAMEWISNQEEDSVIFKRIEQQSFDNLDVLILIMDRRRWSWQGAFNLRQELNRVFAKQDKVVLEDHPDYKEKIGNINMSNGKYCLLFVQKKSKLNKFSKLLSKTTDYYNNWSKKELDDVVTWRFEDPE